MAEGSFGCDQCFKADATAMARARTKFKFIASLVDESHFSISVLGCPRCGQRCLSIFTEMINWTGGDDSQYVTVLPITREELEALPASGDDLVARIEALGRDRAYWQHDHPSGARRQVGWASGALRIGPHD